ncbi:hypothetical protein HBB16_21655 [Pseudonocardia sp. MCCB 268]|nr:hypothetical protein [Pseudonocardia cytotoxica]
MDLLRRHSGPTGSATTASPTARSWRSLRHLVPAAGPLDGVDGVVDPRWYRANLNQDAFERNIGVFDWVAKNDATYHTRHQRRHAVEQRHAPLRAVLKVLAGVGRSALRRSGTDIFLRAGYKRRRVRQRRRGVRRRCKTRPRSGRSTSRSPTDDNNYAVYPPPSAPTRRSRRTGDLEARLHTKRSTGRHRSRPGQRLRANACLELAGATGAPRRSSPARCGRPAAHLRDLDGATPVRGALQARRTSPGSALIEGLGGYTHSAPRCPGWRAWTTRWPTTRSPGAAETGRRGTARRAVLGRAAAGPGAPTARGEGPRRAWRARRPAPPRQPACQAKCTYP